MHILFVSPYFKPYIGGIERVLDELSRQLLQDKHVEKVSILTTFSNYPRGVYANLASEDVDAGRYVYRLSFYPRDIPLIYHSYNAGFFSHTLPSVLLKVSPDVVHFCKTEWYIPNVLTYLFTRHTSRHVFFSSYHPKNLRLKHWPMVWFNRFLLKRVNAIHVPSRFVACDLSSIFRVPMHRISVIPNGVRPPRCIAQELRTKEPVRILSVGRLEIRKGQIELLQMFAELPRHVQEKTSLHLVGPDQGSRQQIFKLVQLHRLHNVVLHGLVPDDELFRLYRETDIYALPSRLEAFGLSALEAMAHGLPVVAFRQGALPEFATKGAILVEPGNWSKFAEAIVLLVHDNQLRARLGQQAREHVEGNYEWGYMAQQVARLYREIMGAGSR